MKRLSAALILALYASSSLASTLPSTVTTTTTTIPGNSSLLDDVIEATNARNNLKVVPSSQIGQTLVTSAELSATTALSGLTMGAAGIAGLAYYQRTGKDPVYAAAASIASAADAIFVPAYQAFKANFVSPESFPASAAQYIGEEGSVGASLASISELAVSAPGTYPLINNLITQNTNSGNSPVSSIPSGAILTSDIGNFYITAGPNNGGAYTLASWNSAMSGMTKVSGVNGYIWHNASWTIFYLMYLGDLQPNGYYTAWFYDLKKTTSPVTYNPPGGINFETLKASIEQANKDAAFADEVRSAISALPSDQKITSANPNPTSVPASSPSPITNNDISNFFTANTTNVYNQYLNTVNNGGDVNTAQAAAELAKAQAEEAEKETEEKFNPLDANPFQNPYNPGPFDIPTRFTTFLQNVKSSGLFSFSSAFFDSLPGGGSPVYTVHAGHYGTHTIDLSDTMTTGLAVLKSILLACFGFLSIRAVIMKR